MDEWYFNEKEIREIILNKQGKYKIDIQAIIMPIIVGLLMLFWGISNDNMVSVFVSINLLFIIIYFVFFFSKVFENIEIIKKLKKCIMQVILFFLISLFVKAIYNLLLLMKLPLKSFTLKGVTYSPENILLLFQIISCWILFVVSMGIKVENGLAPLFLLIMYAICKIIQEITIWLSFIGQSKYVKWIFKKDVHKIENFFVQFLVILKSVLIVFPFIKESTLSNDLISIVLISGIYSIINYIKNNFSYNPSKEYLLNVIKNLENILSKLEKYNSDNISVKIIIKPYYLYCDDIKNQKINNAFKSINDLCFYEKKVIFQIKEKYIKKIIL